MENYKSEFIEFMVESDVLKFALAGVAHGEADASGSEIRDKRVVRRTDQAEPFRRRVRRGTVFYARFKTGAG